MDLRIFQLDVFGSSVFKGNPAGVVLNNVGLLEESMLNIAKEMNLSETAFVTTIDEKNYSIRFFTPVQEVDLCGHASIASFYVLAEKGYIPLIKKGMKEINLLSKAGNLTIEIYYSEGRVEKIMMEQASPKDLGPVEDFDKILEAMNIDRNDVGIGSEFVYPRIISTGLPDIQLPLKNKKTLDSLDVNYGKLSNLSEKTRTIGLHAFHLPEKDSKTAYARNFAPYVGINEEAATGTANGGLIFFLKNEGYLEGDELIVRQGMSLGRPSKIYSQIREDNGAYNVKIGGEAVIFMEGLIYLS